ncbi:MAG: TatD family deoxyribonuclease [Bacteroidetes bacterium QS_8_68_15]|nr:MAG: TatD family deoxyribonuclease [Bacteroidetes bacterium QS_8_68_15]
MTDAAVSLTDTHAHLYFERFDEDRAEVLRRAAEAGVESIVMPAVDVDSIGKAARLCRRQRKQETEAPELYAMAALHPSETDTASPSDFDQVAAWTEHKHVVAVGETGLDHYHDRSFDDRQDAFFRQHVRLALGEDLPLVLHHREATDATLDVLATERRAAEHPERLRGILHCFTGTPAQAERAVELGFLIGLGGILTFSNSDLDDLACALNLGDLVVETDAPYLAPEPHRGERNEPAYVRPVAEYLADVKGVSFEEVARTTTTNARRIYDLPGGGRPTTDGGPSARNANAT